MTNFIGWKLLKLQSRGVTEDQILRFFEEYDRVQSGVKQAQNAPYIFKHFLIQKRRKKDGYLPSTV
jgi:hypothetical protein